VNTSLAFSHPVDDEIIRALQDLQPNWTPADVNSEPQVRQGAVGMLVRCGFVQGKRAIEATCDGLPGVFHAMIRISGCYDSDGVLEQFVKTALPKEWLAGSHGIRLQVRGVTALRLTMTGEEAKRDVEGGEQWKVLAFMHSLPHVTPSLVLESQRFVLSPSDGVAQMAVAQAQNGDVIVNNQITVPPIVVNIDGATLSPTIPPVVNNGSYNQATGSTDPNVEREQVLVGLQPADRKAFLAYHYAERMTEKRLQDREAYDWLKENEIDAGKGDVGELADYRLPAFDTWGKQLRNARKPLGEQKYTRRSGRHTSRSIVSGREI
jgi:hypothetical protein